MGNVAIVGVGRTAFTRCSGRTVLDQAIEAGRHAIADAGSTVDVIDGISTYQMNDSVSPLDVARGLGIDELRWATDLSGGANMVIAAIDTAASSIRAGQCRAVLVYRALNGRSGFRYATADAAAPIGGEFQFSAPQGYAVAPQLMAMWAQRHQHVYGSTCEDLGHIAVTERAHAVANPHAIARSPLTLEAYLEGRFVNEPLRIFDCAYEVDGAVALLLADPEATPDLSHPPVWIRGSAHSQSGAGWDQWPDLTTMYSHRVGPRLWQSTGLSPSDMDLACLYDCFTYTLMATFEDFGFCEKGKVGPFFAAGRATYGGDVVVNPHGGLLSEGYLHGLNHHFEAVIQLRGAAGERQVPGARYALVTAGAGPFGSAAIYTSEAG